MRPVGDVRKALSEAAEALAKEASAATWREISARANVGFKVGRNTVQNMERAGVLEKVGVEKRAHSKRWMVLYAPPGAPCSAAESPGPALDTVLRTWSRP